MEKRIDSCKCAKCRSACTNKPGWFAPGEAERVAEFLKIPLQELFDQYLMVDWLEAEDGLDEVFILSPAVVGFQGGMAPADPRGRCIFYKNNLCAIHEVKPKECHDCVACKPKTHEGLHIRVGDMWRNTASQEQTEELLGRKPESEPFFGILW